MDTKSTVQDLDDGVLRLVPITQKRSSPFHGWRIPLRNERPSSVFPPFTSTGWQGPVFLSSLARQSTI
ncbi:hypothetical protein CIHG_04577 [Coccidioides immitis H538.4]|uniref:Uncharacterized protein n=1 Tax=Coccidioides immitis H538.4 TaxID=396776 RepID=A0A0J8UH87_COCIT|nr:hypothetical protein CIHG_04577 [Coccidioides immitis H538.4]